MERGGRDIGGVAFLSSNNPEDRKDEEDEEEGGGDGEVVELDMGEAVPVLPPRSRTKRENGGGGFAHGLLAIIMVQTV